MARNSLFEGGCYQGWNLGCVEIDRFWRIRNQDQAAAVNHKDVYSTRRVRASPVASVGDLCRCTWESHLADIDVCHP